MITYEQFIRKSIISKESIDLFLDDSRPTWCQFDPDTGYILGNSLLNDGMDGCATISTTQKSGYRTTHIYADRKCRINTYGNSFTHCLQVSDGETWQEYLAGHLGEPIRNYGVGGYGVYQAYRRMVKAEQTDDDAKYVILYIWGDDHCRSVMRCRHAVIYPWWDIHDGLTFHGNFWSNVEMDLESGRFVEKPNILFTPESLYQMTDPEFMFDALKDDLMAQLYSIRDADPSSLDLESLNALAEVLGVPGLGKMKDDSMEAIKAWMEELKNAYGFAATKYTIEETLKFCKDNDKELLILLLCPRVTPQLLNNQPRYDQEIVDYLDENKLLYFDMNVAHFEDYKSFNLSVRDYMKRYFIGHYSPVGNHLFAYSIKDTIVDWLDPKPITYRTDNQKLDDFSSYMSN